MKPKSFKQLYLWGLTKWFPFLACFPLILSTGCKENQGKMEHSREVQVEEVRLELGPEAASYAQKFDGLESPPDPLMFASAWIESLSNEQFKILGGENQAGIGDKSEWREVIVWQMLSLFRSGIASESKSARMKVTLSEVPSYGKLIQYLEDRPDSEAVESMLTDLKAAKELDQDTFLLKKGFEIRFIGRVGTLLAPVEPEVANEQYLQEIEAFYAWMQGVLDDVKSLDQHLPRLVPSSPERTKVIVDFFEGGRKHQADDIADIKEALRTPGGIGVVLQLGKNGVTIAKFAEKSAAETAGILEGDLLIGVNGDHSVAGEMSTLRKALIGDSGTKVEVLVKRNGEERVFEVERTKIELSPMDLIEFGYDHAINRLVKKGDKAAKYALAWNYEHGLKREEDHRRAAGLYEEIAGEHYPLAVYRLAWLQQFSLPFSQKKEAAGNFTKAAKLGVFPAKVYLGITESRRPTKYRYSDVAIHEELQAKADGLHRETEQELKKLLERIFPYAGGEQILEQLNKQLFRERELRLYSKKLICYPDGMFWVVCGDYWSMTILEAGGRFALGHGEASEIHQFNKIAPLDLSTIKKAREYILLFSSLIQGEHGNFRMITDNKNLMWYPKVEDETKAAVINSILPLQVAKRKEGYFAEGTMLFSGRLTKVEMSLAMTGVMQITEDTPIFDVPLWREKFESYRRYIFPGGEITGSKGGFYAAQNKMYYDRSTIKANAGDASAQYSLGRFYLLGRGCEKDVVKAKAWFEQSAAQGKQSAMIELAQIFEEGKYLDKDLDKAIKYYRLAIKSRESGSSITLLVTVDEAIYKLAMLLTANGKGDMKEALSLLRRAAEGGYAEASAELGRRFKSGNGIKVDIMEAEKWLSKAVKAGHGQAAYDLGFIYYTDKYGKEDSVKAFNYFKLGAEKNNGHAQYMTGYCLYKGAGTAKDYGEAVNWLEKSAQKWNADAQYLLGNCYAEGKGKATSELEARVWWRRAANQGHAQAKEKLK